jgi:hypothetical protein
MEVWTSPPLLPSSNEGVLDLWTGAFAGGRELPVAVATTDTANLCVVDATGSGLMPEGGDVFAAVLE